MNWLRRLLPYLGVLIVAGLIYDGAIFYSRWNARRGAEQAQKDAELAKDRKVVKLLGSDSLKIVSFYAAPSTLKRGAHTNLCYGVSGAKKVKLEPAVDEVWPSMSRCVQASPRATTEYLLTAEDEAGHTATKALTVNVIRKP
jgi:hypothetical protein